MKRVEVTHWLCDRPITVTVDDDYDLDRGLAVTCPKCRDTFWHFPRLVGEGGALPAAKTVALRSPVSAAEGSHAASDRGGLSSVVADPASGGAARRAPGVPAGGKGRAPGIVSVDPMPARQRRSSSLPPWFGPLLIVAGVAAIAIALSNRNQPSPSARQSTAGPVPRGRDEVAVRIAGRRAVVLVPPGWHRTHSGSALELGAGTTSTTTVRFSSPGRAGTPIKLSKIRRGMRGAKLSPVRTVRIAGLPASRVIVTNGAARREATAVDAGGRRYLVVLDTPRDTRRKVLDTAHRVVDAFVPAR